MAGVGVGSMNFAMHAVSVIDGGGFCGSSGVVVRVTGVVVAVEVVRWVVVCGVVTVIVGRLLLLLSMIECVILVFLS